MAPSSGGRSGIGPFTSLDVRRFHGTLSSVWAGWWIMSVPAQAAGLPPLTSDRRGAVGFF
jgi:hypothetical protein